MDQQRKSVMIKYCASFLMGGGLFYIYLHSREFPVAEASENCRMIADAATIPGLLFIMFGALTWAASLGATDGLAYGLRRLFRAMIPGAAMQEDESYAEYIEKRHEKYKNVKNYAFLFITGAVFMAVAILFIVLFYNI